MRRRWEEEETTDDKLDEPITITGRQLRSLQRGARVGLFGVLLAIVAIGLAAWNLVSSRGGEANNEVSPASATVAPADSGAMAVQPAVSGAATAGAPAGATPQAVQPPVPAPAVKPAVRRTRVAAAKLSSPSGRKPETGVPIDMPAPTLSVPTARVAPAAAPAPAKAAPADTAKGS